METFQVREPLDVYEPRRAVQVLAERVGFSRSECKELAIVVSELVSNIVKYGVRGSIELEEAWDSARGRGVAIAACDVGPPFHDLAMAMQDGYDDRGPIDPLHLLKRRGIGAGLGAVVRLTDTFHVEPLAVGKRVCAVRYLKRRPSKKNE
jgi:anti-sigma regulatory factor (Ser/Thr protein kinase)